MSKIKVLFLLSPLLVATVAVVLSLQSATPERFAIMLPSAPRLADGRTPLVVHFTLSGGSLRSEDLRFRILEGEKFAVVESAHVEGGRGEIRLRPRVLAGKIAFELRARGFAPQRGEFETVASTSDSVGDGTPDFLRLGSEDRQAFRNWFTYLAELQYYRPKTRVSKEINDCAALIRFAYRETFRSHDADWVNALDLDDAFSFPDVKKYQYPYTPLGAALFRKEDGAFQWDDLNRGAFAQFADAHTLQQFNTFLVSRRIEAAEPGDLLFYRQLDQNMPFHAMIFLGRSHFEPDDSPRLVYHTGPIHGEDGEIRRPTVAMLLAHPEPKWRPVPSNTNFLGVYRWNILQ